ncbi:erg10, acetyl-CoA C-acetyltransferase [Nowakowskiella sp. JEL0407]|nr:erg10, acetyl-CoA C-acetyltransferase [Nowakowskiella sp. JEL0407]
MQEVVILSAVRTPVGSFLKSLSKLSATELGTTALRGAISKSGLSPNDIEEVFMGNVLSSGLGQSPARQVTIGAGCPISTESTTVNKVCASGMKAAIFAVQSLQLGYRNVVAAGGMESMSNSPFLSPRNASYGHQTLMDSIIKDGLWDVYNDVHMGTCAEETAKEYGISRKDQDDHAIKSYKRAAEAWKLGKFKNEVVPVSIKSKKGEIVVEEDEEYKNIIFDKVSKLSGAFEKNGTVTAANSSTLNDGASGLVFSSLEFAQSRGINPLARVISYADAACEPKKFTIAPSLAIPKALKAAGMNLDDVSLFEINEAFSVVVRVNEKILGIDPEKNNVNGGGVALGHPIGSSGSRILVSLVHALKKGEIGVGAICNGGGAASAMVIEKL